MKPSRYHSFVHYCISMVYPYPMHRTPSSSYTLPKHVTAPFTHSPSSSLSASASEAGHSGKRRSCALPTRFSAWFLTRAIGTGLAPTGLPLRRPSPAQWTVSPSRSCSRSRSIPRSVAAPAYSLDANGFAIDNQFYVGSSGLLVKPVTGRPSSVRVGDQELGTNCSRTAER